MKLRVHRPFLRNVGLVIALLILSVRWSVAQQGTVVLTESRCSSCRIVVDSMGYIGYPEEADINVSWRRIPARDSRGRIYVTGSNMQTSTAVFAFDSVGRLLHTIGNQGEGPGEFRGPIHQLHVGPSDLLYFLEPVRGYIFDSDRRPLRVATYPTPVGGALATTAVLSDGRIARATAPQQITLLPAAGADSPGPVRVRLEASDTTCRVCGDRTLGRALQGGTIWSMPRNEYVIEQHDLTGKLLVRYQRNAPWYRKWGLSDLNVNTSSPIALAALNGRSLPLGVRESADGLLWVFMRVLDPDVPIPSDLAMPQGVAGWDEFHRTYSAVYVEVIDLASRQVLATRKFKSIMVYSIGDGYAVRVDPTEIGGGAFTILRLRLER